MIVYLKSIVHSYIIPICAPYSSIFVAASIIKSFSSKTNLITIIIVKFKYLVKSLIAAARSSKIISSKLTSSYLKS